MTFTDSPSEAMTTELLRVDELEADNKRLRETLLKVREVIYNNKDAMPDKMADLLGQMIDATIFLSE